MEAQGSARRRREQKQRAQWKHVSWLTRLAQAGASHHTGAAAGAAGQEQLLTLCKQLVQRVSALERVLLQEGKIDPLPKLQPEPAATPGAACPARQAEQAERPVPLSCSQATEFDATADVSAVPIDLYASDHAGAASPRGRAVSANTASPLPTPRPVFEATTGAAGPAGPAEQAELPLPGSQAIEIDATASAVLIDFHASDHAGAASPRGRADSASSTEIPEPFDSYDIPGAAGPSGQDSVGSSSQAAHSEALAQVEHRISHLLSHAPGSPLDRLVLCSLLEQEDRLRSMPGSDNRSPSSPRSRRGEGPNNSEHHPADLDPHV